MIPITMAEAGDVVKIVRLGGRGDVKSHLRDLGFTENTEVTIVAKNGGNLILQVKDGRVAMDASMASKIFY